MAINSGGFKSTETGLTVTARAKQNSYSSVFVIFVTYRELEKGMIPVQLQKVIQMGFIKFPGHVFKSAHSCALVNDSVSSLRTLPSRYTQTMYKGPTNVNNL